MLLDYVWIYGVIISCTSHRIASEGVAEPVGHHHRAEHIGPTHQVQLHLLLFLLLSCPDAEDVVGSV